jgi:glycerol kinase
MSFLAIDQGTTGTTALLVDPEGRVQATAMRAHTQHHPRPGWVEHDASEIWRCMGEAIDEVLARVAGPVEGIGLANQGETVLAWDEDGPLHPAIVWQDTRTQSVVDALAEDAALSRRVTERTGLPLDPYFSATKAAWILDHVPGARERATRGEVHVGTLDTWLLERLTGERTTDESTAARTLLFDIHTRRWDPELCEVFRVPRISLSTVRPSVGARGTARGLHPRLEGVPVVASIVDQTAALFGHGCLVSGTMKATYGTGCFVTLNTGGFPVMPTEGLLATLAWTRDDGPTYALDGGVLAAGSVLTWLRDRVGILEGPEALDLLPPPRARSSVVCVPALAGLGCPWWKREARAAWLGMGLETSAGDLVHAAVEGIAGRVAQVVRAIERAGGLSVEALRVDGGLTRSRRLVQCQADWLGVPLEVSREAEATALGVAYLGMRSLGLWASDDEVLARRSATERVEPAMPASERAWRIERFDQACQVVSAWKEPRWI